MSLNRVQLIGNVGKDPDVRYLDSGVAVATFSLATTDRGYTLANGTQVPERTEWHNIVLWQGLAETAEKYVRKGDKLYIEGKIRSRSYDDQNGVKRYVVEVFGDKMELFSSPTPFFTLGMEICPLLTPLTAPIFWGNTIPYGRIGFGPIQRNHSP